MMPKNNTLFAIHRYVAIDDGCWLWTGRINKRQHTNKIAYGGMSMRNREHLAHRLMYEFFYGVHPGKLEVCHTCDNTICVRPSHLFLGTHTDNMRDMMRKKRLIHRKGEKHPLAKLTDADIPKIRSAPGTQKEIAAQFGVTHSMISLILRRKNWRHIP